MRAHKTLCPICRRAYSPKRGCSHRFDRPPLPTVHLKNGNSVKVHPIRIHTGNRSSDDTIARSVIGPTLANFALPKAGPK